MSVTPPPDDYFAQSPHPVEQVVRFAYKREHIFQGANPYVKPALFADPQLSVYRTVGLANDRIWHLWFQHLQESLPNEKLKGRAMLRIVDIQSLNLVPEPDNVPERHVTILGWPEHPEFGEQLTRELHQALVARSVVEVYSKLPDGSNLDLS